MESCVSFAPGTDHDTAINEAEVMFRRDGVVVLSELVDPVHLARCRDQIEAAYPDYAQVDRERNFGSYTGRHTAPIQVAGALADRAVFLPHAVKQLARRLLGDDFVLDSFGLLASLPGAPDQKRHFDALLFPEKGIDGLLPPFALAFALPLVPTNAVSGTTAFWRGSHRKPGVTGPYDFAPILEPGSALLWDFRVLHCGLANQSAVPRSAIFSVLCRNWWREVVGLNAFRYEKLTLTSEVYDELEPAMRQIVSRATIAGAEPMHAFVLPNGR